MTTDKLIAGIAAHLAAADIDARADFLKQLDGTLKPYGVCIMAHPSPEPSRNPRGAPSPTGAAT